MYWYAVGESPPITRRKLENKVYLALELYEGNRLIVEILFA